MIAILFCAVNLSRVDEPQKNHHGLRRAFEGPILAHDDFLLMLCNKQNLVKNFSLIFWVTDVLALFCIRIG